MTEQLGLDFIRKGQDQSVRAIALSLPIKPLSGLGVLGVLLTSTTLRMLMALFGYLSLILWVSLLALASGLFNAPITVA